MEKPGDLFYSTWSNLSSFIHERQELFLQSPSLLWVLWHFSCSKRSWGRLFWGTGVGKTAVPAENPCSSALNAAPAWEMHSLSAVDECFFSDKGESWAMKSATWGNHRRKVLLINSETCWTSAPGKVRDVIINGSTGKKNESETQVLADKYSHKYS